MQLYNNELLYRMFYFKLFKFRKLAGKNVSSKNYMLWKGTSNQDKINLKEK